MYLNNSIIVHLSFTLIIIWKTIFNRIDNIDFLFFYFHKFIQKKNTFFGIFWSNYSNIDGTFFFHTILSKLNLYFAHRVFDIMCRYNSFLITSRNHSSTFKLYSLIRHNLKLIAKVCTIGPYREVCMFIQFHECIYTFCES